MIRPFFVELSPGDIYEDAQIVRKCTFEEYEQQQILKGEVVYDFEKVICNFYELKDKNA